ncbi:MAG: TonB family protein [candidate division KSB1 bacterium]|nr:TonB family protein [candidate division KSB1 bacterium]
MNIAVRTSQFLRGEMGRSAVLSLLLHALVFLLLALVTLQIEFFPPEFAEVTFISGERGVLPPPAGPAVAPIDRQAPPPQQTTQQQPVQQETVTLPPRRMLEREPAEQLPRSGEKVDVAQTMPQVEAPAPGLQERGLHTISTGQEGKASAPSSAGVGQKETPPTLTGPSAGAQESFRIEGEAAQREILYKVIPEYPPGLQREAVVRVRFVVLPDGSVGGMVPLLKGDATLERLTLEALRQWRFNPLPPHVPQNEVTGIITFRYLLR